MDRGRVYIWLPDATHPLGGRVSKEVVPLLRLEQDGDGKGKLWGRHVQIRNAGAVNELDQVSGVVRPVAIGDSEPNEDGDYLFEPGRGGGRIEKVTLAAPDFRWRYILASRFGETNTYYHIDRIASYVDVILKDLGAGALPRVVAVVNAHHAATEISPGVRDGIQREQRWLPFQGGHYRLPNRRLALGGGEIPEREALSRDGEIHLGPGRQLCRAGALAEYAGDAYRANASHNAGIIYHEYGHHITRHLADFRANFLRPPDHQSNRKTALDEGTCDYWVATMLGTPHIWAWHHRHDEQGVHLRSLSSARTMAEFDRRKTADSHLNGTIWGAALWDLRADLSASEPDGARQADRLLVQALLLMGQLMGHETVPTVKGVGRARAGFATGLNALLQADEMLFSSRHRDLIQGIFAKRGIFSQSRPEPRRRERGPSRPSSGLAEPSRASLLQSCPQTRGMLKHVSPDDIPETGDLFSAETLTAQLETWNEPPLSLIAVGDIMLDGRARRSVRENGLGYPFQAVRPLLRRAPVVLGNLEGPFARVARKLERPHSYRVNPKLAASLTDNGINVVTLANNHLLDCGREGVMQTLEALKGAGVAVIGGGINRQAAHAPGILQSGAHRIGLLGYYWNRRTSATGSLPGSAMDPAEDLAADISALRKRVDRVIVTFHWGVPYVREPSPEDQAKARFAVECGADAVIGHHPHIVQPFEIHRDRPIFYSVGNFTFGSANSRAESLLLGYRFEKKRTSVYVYPVYVKNRDPRVNCQPKILRGAGAERVLRMLAQISGRHAPCLAIESGRGKLVLPWCPSPFLK